MNKALNNCVSVGDISQNYVGIIMCRPEQINDPSELRLLSSFSIIVNK